MKKCQKVRLILGVLLLLMFSPADNSMAGEERKSNIKDGEIVFLLDASGSMNTYDKNRLAIDAVWQAANSLPSNYEAGLVSYNTGNQAVVPLGAEMDQMDAQLTAITYAGYTNAGEGLNQAVNLFSEKEGVERAVIMISDGEIDMKGSEQTEWSRALFVETANKAREQGIKVYIVAVGNELKKGMHIFDAAEITEGAIYWEGASGSLTQIMNRILTERINLPMQELGVNDSNGGSIQCTIPEGAGRVTLLVSGRLENVTADYRAENGKTVSGQCFATVDIIRPTSEYVEVQFETTDISGIQAFLMTEYTAELKVDTEYRIEELPRTEEEEKKKVLPKYDHFVDITIELTDVGGTHKNLLLTEKTDDMELTCTINGIPFKGSVRQGVISHTIPADGIEEVEVAIDADRLGDLGAIYYIEQPVTAIIEKYPDPVPPEPKPDYRPLWVIIGLLAVALIVLVTMWIKKKNTTVIYVAQPPAAKEPSKKMETKSCTYTGKINMYVIRTGDGRDVPPQTYRLFGRKAGSMTLEQILTSCKIKLGKIGAGDINFYPGPDRSIIIMDQSEGCTVLRGTEILKKGMGYPVFYNEKITITFDDEETEMEIHYKDLKPSEREA